MHPRCSLRALAVMLALASVALAIDHPITGDSLVLKDPMAESDRKVRFKATHDAAIDPSQASTRTSAAASSGASAPAIPGPRRITPRPSFPAARST